MANKTVPLDIPAGVVKTDSPNAADGRLTNTQLARFIAGKPTKWRGWETYLSSTTLGCVRSMLPYTDSSQNRIIGLGDEKRLYSITGDDTLTNITPVRASGNLGNNPFTTNGTTTVSVAHTSHGIGQVGTYVTFADSDAVDGLDMDATWTVDAITDDDNYTFIHTSTASGSTAGGGGTTPPTYSYEIDVGFKETTEGLGYGAGNFGAEDYGDERAAGIVTDSRIWSLAEYGREMLASYSGGSLYVWDSDITTNATLVANSPPSARAMFVTGERYIFMCGTDVSDMTIEWPDVDDKTAWTPSATNTANTRTLQSGNRIEAGSKLYDFTSLVWTDTSVYVFQYNGGEFVYDSRLAGTSCGLIGPKAFTIVNGVAYWMSGHGFHQYHGAVTDIQRQEDIRDWVFKNIKPDFSRKFFTGYNAKDDEILFFYVSKASTDNEPDAYVAVCRKDWSWSNGLLPRTAHSVLREQHSSTIMAGTDNYIYQHETGLNANGSAMNSSVTYGLYSEMEGRKNLDIMGFIPDFTTQVGDIDIELFTKDRPQSATNLEDVTTTVSEGDEIEDIRLSGRHFGFTIRSNTLGGDYEVGDVAVEVEDGGSRR